MHHNDTTLQKEKGVDLSPKHHIDPVAIPVIIFFAEQVVR